MTTRARMKLSPVMLRVLDNAAHDRPLLDGARGRSQHGGRSLTIKALKRRGLLTSLGNITPDGAKAWRQAHRAS